MSVGKLKDVKRIIACCVCVALFLLGGCGEARPGADDPASAQKTPLKPEPVNKAQNNPSKGATAGADLSGLVIALDPGHNGGNASHPSEANKQVPDGRGGTKACNTTGTATDDGFPEHTFNWKVSRLVRADLEDLGARVIMSRDSNDGVGPCVDERGTFADDADFLVSIHANGSDSTSIQGFGVIVAPGKQVRESTRLAQALVDAFTDNDFPINRSGYGKDGVVERTDLAGLNNASVPAVIVECGEMRNPHEADLMKNDQDTYAQALVAGITAYAEQLS